MTSSIMNSIAGMAGALLCIFLAGTIGLLTMTSLSALSIQDSTEVAQMRTSTVVEDTALSTTDAPATL